MAAAPSTRLALARAARDAATAVDGVVSSGEEAAADAAGGYAVTLRLVTRLVPLPPLVERVRAAVERDLAGAGLAGELARLDVVVEDVVD